MQEWKPRYGYKRINDPKEDWVLEVPQNAGSCILHGVNGKVESGRTTKSHPNYKIFRFCIDCTIRVFQLFVAQV